MSSLTDLPQMPHTSHPNAPGAPWESAMLRAALRYIERGIPVFPLRPRGKTPAINRSQGGHGFLDATTNEPIVQAWWRMRAQANIGVPTGARSGWVILDVDPRHGGSIEDLVARLHSRWPTVRGFSMETQRVRSGSGGLHLYFRHPGAGVLVPSRKLFKRVNERGVLVADSAYEIKADGGYIVAPPSIHPDGPRYEWMEKTPFAEMPDWLLTLVSEPDDEAEDDEAEDDDEDDHNTARSDDDGRYWLNQALARTGDGIGDDMGYWLAVQLLANHVATPRAYLLTYVAQASMNPHDPFDTQDVDRWLESAAGSEIVRRGEPAHRQGDRQGKAAAERAPRAPAAHNGHSGHGDAPLPRQHTAAPATIPAPPPPEQHEPDLPEDGSEDEHRTDLGNARRFARRHGQDVRYVGAWGQWLVWDGTRFRRDVTDAVVRMAKETVVHLYREAAAIEEEQERKELARWALRSEAEPRLRALLTLAQSEPGVAIASEQLDREGWRLNVRNGMVNLRNGRLEPHRREALCTKRADASYDAQAACPTWTAFLERIFAGDREMIAYVQRAVGYALTAQTGEQVVFVLYGAGANGKSTWEDTLGRILGDYAMTTPMETFQTKQGQTIPSDVARLVGARFVAASESADGRRLDEELIKRISGGDRMSARFLHRDWFEFYPVLKLFLAVNHRPTIRGTDHGIWRRIHLWPFEVSIPKEEQDPGLKRKLLAEASGILAWAVQGCLAWQAVGLCPPAKVLEATAEYRTEMDAIGRFVADRCTCAPERTATAKALYDAYKAWCAENGEREQSQTRFGLYLRDQGHRKAKNGAGTVIWRGIGLLEGTQSQAPPGPG